MNPSRFLRYMDLKDEWEAPEPGQIHYQRWSWIWLGISIALLVAALTVTAWLYIPLWVALILHARASFIWDVAIRERADLLAEMKGLAYEPN